MIGGILMVLAVIWVYQSVNKAKVSNPLMWVAIAAGVFFVVQMLLVQANVFILEAVRGSESSGDYERDLLSVGDRKNQGGFQGVGGYLLSVFFELMPPLAGVLAVAFVRLKFITKESFSIGNLFSGIKEMFTSISQSFKTPE
ncbi:hypothetical protein [Candidatus Methylomicrobium oryzae]|jgi:hypothetical protein|uniref:hypothetical protein n=1 Tax=Candidatus Methylomicrobium oryzae TaxID=2802053 RepID=UPI001924BEF5|nr:hypothetical protein [Methylomicrobium sp. RS1]MBL1263772.1 hypothetical protein [Methylomicrobium sp. RS1]